MITATTFHTIVKMIIIIQIFAFEDFLKQLFWNNSNLNRFNALRLNKNSVAFQ